VIEVRVSAPESSPAWKRLPRFKAVWRFAAVLAIAVAVVFAAVSLVLLGMRGNIVINQPTSILPKAVPLVSPQSASTATDSPLAAPSPALPTSFGIYAVSQDKLYELDLLPGRAPDMRVAISPVITTHSRTTLPAGHLTFIVYRRDSATNAADRAEVRLIARIARETSFDKDGKQIASEVGDMRNISIRCIEPRRKRTIRTCTKSKAKIRILHCHQVAMRWCSKARPTILALRVSSLIPGNAWSDWRQPTVSSIPNAGSSN